ncbi:PIH1 domain-containing protein 2 [Cichlidogyrus casuarinus]|uniref:PIH1 domain-containing protein 2 n=1 Tax=Cichlidogyrus casuarinus TaxID=1844966 RepID=A0ABD2QEW1_9PLAT
MIIKNIVTRMNETKLNSSLNPNEIWAMLDRLQQSEPQKYREFVKKQIEEGSRRLSKPKFRFAIELQTKSHNFRYLVIVYVEWSSIPTEVENSESLPMRASALLDSDSSSKKIVILSFNQKVIDQHLETKDDANQLLWLGAIYCHNELAIETILSHEVMHSDSPSTPFMIKTNSFISEEDICKAFGIDSSLFEYQLAEKIVKNEDIDISDMVNSASQKYEEEGRLTEENLLIPGNKTKKSPNLIEELNANLIEWSYFFTTQREDSIKFLSLAFKLPGIHSISEVEIDISKDTILMNVVNFDPLSIKLPCSIVTSSAKAKLNTKKEILHVIAQTLPGHV